MRKLFPRGSMVESIKFVIGDATNLVVYIVVQNVFDETRDKNMYSTIKTCKLKRILISSKCFYFWKLNNNKLCIVSKLYTSIHLYAILTLHNCGCLRVCSKIQKNIICLSIGNWNYLCPLFLSRLEILVG